MPHPPQFEELVFVSTQLFPHFAKPWSQVKPQTLPVHVAAPFAGASQTVPHAPQCSGSLSRLMHDPLQSVKPVWQITPHALSKHTASPFWGSGHGSLHWPQCFAEDVRSTQARSQSVSAPAHVAAQPPIEHTWSNAQLTAQSPQ